MRPLFVGVCVWWFIAFSFAAPADRRAVIRERAGTLAGFTGQRIADATPEVLAQAEQIAKGTVYFYSRTPVQVGLKNIDWTGGHIRHQEWPAQLNRFFHLGPLASAYRSTHQERFAKAARAYMEDWIRGDPYESATTLRPGDNTLNMSIRLGTSHHGGWGAVLPVFLDSPSFDDAFLGTVFASMARQSRFLAAHLTASGNWRISQLDALVFTALRFPFLPGADRMLAAGIMGMRNALATQFLPDGVHIERTPGYADWMTDVLANYLRLARLFPEADAGVNPERLVRALDYGVQSELFGVNDASAPHRDPPALARLSARGELLPALGLNPTPPPLDQVFSSAGQVFSRTAWAPGADYLAFDASTWGGGHSHLSRLSFVFRSKGRMLVADPGILNYEMSDPLGPYGKSTPAHSTLNLGGRNQSGSDAELLRTAFTPEIALIQARYQGAYWDGPYGWNFTRGRGSGVWGDHERVVFWVKGEYIVAIDSMTADDGQEIRNCWQLGPMDASSSDAASFAWWSGNKDVNLALRLVLAPPKTSMQIWEGSREPLRGWVGRHGNDAAPAPLVEFRYPSRRGNPVVSAALVAAFSGSDKPRIEVKRAGASRDGVFHLEFILPDGSCDNIAWTAGLALPVEDGEPFITDGTFAWQRTSAGGKPAKQFVLGGTYLRRR